MYQGQLWGSLLFFFLPVFLVGKGDKLFLVLLLSLAGGHGVYWIRRMSIGKMAVVGGER
jgi:hypothetical protein